MSRRVRAGGFFIPPLSRLTLPQVGTGLAKPAGGQAVTKSPLKAAFGLQSCKLSDNRRVIVGLASCSIWVDMVGYSHKVISLLLLSEEGRGRRPRLSQFKGHSSAG